MVKIFKTAITYFIGILIIGTIVELIYGLFIQRSFSESLNILITDYSRPSKIVIVSVVSLALAVYKNSRKMVK